MFRNLFKRKIALTTTITYCNFNGLYVSILIIYKVQHNNIPIRTKVLIKREDFEVVTYSRATKQITATTDISTCIWPHVQPHASSFHIIFTVQPGLTHLFPAENKYNFVLKVVVMQSLLLLLHRFNTHIRTKNMLLY